MAVLITLIVLMVVAGLMWWAGTSISHRRTAKHIRLATADRRLFVAERRLDEIERIAFDHLTINPHDLTAQMILGKVKQARRELR